MHKNRYYHFGIILTVFMLILSPLTACSSIGAVNDNVSFQYQQVLDAGEGINSVSTLVEMPGMLPANTVNNTEDILKKQTTHVTVDDFGTMLNKTVQVSSFASDEVGWRS